MKTYLATIEGFEIQFIFSTSKPLDQLEHFILDAVQKELPRYGVTSIKYCAGDCFFINDSNMVFCQELNYYKG